MDATSYIVSPDLLPYLCAILALLVLWQYHERLVRFGRIQAIDVFDRLVIRMYISATPDDDHICEACRDTHGRIFLTSRVANRDFTPLRSPCANAERCTRVLIGLYGAWVEARGVVERLRAAKKTGSIQLSPTELRGVIHGQWERSVSVATDRFSVHMLDALSYEKIKPETAILEYRYIIDQAKEVHHLPLQVPAYLRLTELLARHGRVQEALEVIEHFEHRYARKRIGPHVPRDTQRGLMSSTKARLKNTTTSLNLAAAPPIKERMADLRRVL